MAFFLKALARADIQAATDGERVAEAQALRVTTTSIDLLARCRARDASAWKAVHDEHFAFVWRVARRLGTPVDELEDVCQETFIVAFRKLDRFEGGQLTSWLYRITANVVTGRHRRRRVRRALSAALQLVPVQRVEPTPHDVAVAKEAAALVDSVLERMAPKKREVFALFELEGLSGEQIAEHVGCSIGTVWTRLHHARKDFERIARKLELAA